MGPVDGVGHGAPRMPWGWGHHLCVTPPRRYLVVFNPLEQERLSVVPVLVDSPHVRVLSEEGQPLPSQLSAHWGSATDTVPDIYQVWGAPVPLPAPILSLLSPCVPASRPRPMARTPCEPFSVATSVPTPQHKLPLLVNPQAHVHIPPQQKPQKC